MLKIARKLLFWRPSLVGNIDDPNGFKHALFSSLASLSTVFELAREHELPAIDARGITRHSRPYGKSPFQIAGQFDRPAEFLQSLLDMLRVNFEPNPLGTFFLNSNLCFLFDAIPQQPFRLGYFSMVSAENQEFSVFWERKITPYLIELGYCLNTKLGIFLACSTGAERYGLKLIEEVDDVITVTFNIDETISLLKSPNTNSTGSQKTHYAGYCCDSALGTRLRVSGWLFIECEIDSI